MLHLQEEDIYYIFSLFNSRNYTNENMELLRKDFEVVYKNFVLNDLSLNELILQILPVAEIDDADNFIFKQSFYNLSVRCGQTVKYFYRNESIYCQKKNSFYTEK